MPHRIFLLSPANCGGERAKLLFRSEARFELAVQLRTPQGAPIADVFSFLSGLYFRGKIAYARRFADPPPNVPGELVITTNRGLIPADTYVTMKELAKMGTIPIASDDPRYRRPLARSAKLLRDYIGDDCEVVLLGSVASGKYVDILTKIYGQRLLFPFEFVGRGDMSRGGLMLRCVDFGKELSYVPVHGSTRRGQRPPKLEKRVFPIASPSRRR